MYSSLAEGYNAYLKVHSRVKARDAGKGHMVDRRMGISRVESFRFRSRPFGSFPAKHANNDEMNPKTKRTKADRESS